jgi:hypothetical protein
MVKKLVVLAIFFTVLCFAVVGCFRAGARVGVGDRPYYDGPYRIGVGYYYYYNGGFYVHDRGAFRFHQNVPQAERRYYEERHRQNREHYNRDYHSWRDQHPGHPWASQKEEEWR